MDDWQDAAFSNRHMHNRIGGGGRSGRAKATTAFDVTKTFGTYEINCAAAEKISLDGSKTNSSASSQLDLFRLSEDGDGVLGELTLSRVIHAAVVLAGSRKTMNSVVAKLEEHSTNIAIEEGTDNASTSSIASDVEEESESDEDATTDDPAEDEVEERSKQRYRTFEKNSFRSPKFWLRWQGQVLHPAKADSPSTTFETDVGYLVFSKNDCSKLQGTITCKALGWNNVKVQGRKTATRSTRDVPISWLPT